MTTYVLVHGAWHGGWCWQKVVPLLEAAGHQVHAPSLTGAGERIEELSPDVGLDTHISDVVGLLEARDLREVVLVGHSYGGMVITGAVDAVPQRVAHLVYLDTFVPRDGESMVDVSPLVLALVRRQAEPRGGWKIPPAKERRFGPKGLYGVTTEPDLSWVRANVTPQSLLTLEQKLRLRNPAIVSETPRTHIDCTGGGVLFDVLRRILAPRALPPRGPGWRLRQLRTGHDAMITMPQELADLLMETPPDG